MRSLSLAQGSGLFFSYKVLISSSVNPVISDMSVDENPQDFIFRAMTLAISASLNRRSNTLSSIVAILYSIISLKKYEVFLKSARKRRNFLYIRDIVYDNPANHGVRQTH